MKLVLLEDESDALRSFLARQSRTISSEILLAESARAVQRRSETVEASRSLFRALDEVIARLQLRRLERELLVHAGGLLPRGLRTLDAIHLATALSLPRTPAAFVTYDRRQLGAADAVGLATASPGML